MAVNNSLMKQTAAQGDGIVTYMAGNEEIRLSADIVRRYLVSGGGNVTDQEVYMFLQMCRTQHLNPFLREAYCIKYGDRSPATLVVSKETFLKRARRNPDYQGSEAGIIVRDRESGEVKEVAGTVFVKGQELVGGWARVYINGLAVPSYISVPFNEYAGRKSDGSLNGMWASKPATMIRKVALLQALREAFPEDMGGLYGAEEINTVDVEKLPEAPVVVPGTVVEKQPEKEPEQPQEVDEASEAEKALFG
jgi:phage recombination protein Bet